MKVKRPILRYFGGKWQLRHWITSHFPEHQFYAEPFAGAASVLLSKEVAPKGEIINDLNAETINLFRVMQHEKSADELQRRLEWTMYSKRELEIAREHSDDPIENARRLVVRSFMGIEVSGITGNSTTGFRMGNVDLKRFDQEGHRTFRNCAKDWNNWKEALPAIRERLSEVMVYEMDALDFIDLMDSKNCLLYVDAPYAHEGRSQTRYAVEFNRQAELADRLSAAEAMVVLSGYPCPEYDSLKDFGWTRIDKDYRANMSQTRRTECVWISPNARKVTTDAI